MERLMVAGRSSGTDDGDDVDDDDDVTLNSRSRGCY
jgi:hypothetical protein